MINVSEVNVPPGDCIFCDVPTERFLFENDHAYAIYDSFPVTTLHALVIPKRHVADYFGLTQDELMACDSLLHLLKEHVLASDDSVQGFNIGVNAGLVAGQTIFHCHFHLIPRRLGDVDNPRGGLRNVIPGKGIY